MTRDALSQRILNFNLPKMRSLKYRARVTRFIPPYRSLSPDYLHATDPFSLSETHAARDQTQHQQRGFFEIRISLAPRLVARAMTPFGIAARGVCRASTNRFGRLHCSRPINSRATGGSARPRRDVRPFKRPPAWDARISRTTHAAPCSAGTEEFVVVESSRRERLVHHRRIPFFPPSSFALFLFFCFSFDPQFPLLRTPCPQLRLRHICDFSSSTGSQLDRARIPSPIYCALEGFTRSELALDQETERYRSARDPPA